MLVVTGAEMRELDRITIEEIGIPGVVLMEEAGRGTAREIMKHIPPKGNVLIIAGKGNNGGDGFVIHRWLVHWGCHCRTLLLAPKTEIRGDAAVHLAVLEKLGEDVQEILDEGVLQTLWPALEDYDLIVDGIFGTGLSGEVRGIGRRAIELINKTDRPVLSIDIPSGLDGVHGVPLGVAVKADLTVTFGLPKLGMLLHPGSQYVGELIIHDIGIPEQVIESAKIRRVWMNGKICKEMLPFRPVDGHKGTFGRVLVLAGSCGMTGAAALTSEAVLRSGAGLVTLGIVESLNPVLEAKLTEVMTYPLPEKDGQLAKEAIPAIRKLMKTADIVTVGPGLGQSADLVQILSILLTEWGKPLVIDADGLNNLHSVLHLLKKRSAMTVLTPHPGEMARLTGLSVGEVQADRIGLAERFAGEYGVILVLKGSPTITALPDGQIFLNSTGNEGMGTGGSGDVLTGIISGMLAQQTEEISIPCGVYVHGLAGDLIAKMTNHRSLIAGDLLKGLALAFRELENEE